MEVFFVLINNIKLLMFIWYIYVWYWKYFWYLIVKNNIIVKVSCVDMVRVWCDVLSKVVVLYIYCILF